jgi:acyl-CoA synthetase (NDP forming)
MTARSEMNASNNDADDRLKRMLSPKGIAVVGASERSDSMGGQLFDNLLRWYSGNLYPVNPKSQSIGNVRCFSSLIEVPEDVDLVVIVVNAEFVPELVQQSAAIGAAGVLIISSGFGEVGIEGIKLQDAIVKISAETGLRIMGPNCIGFLNAQQGLAATFAPIPDDDLRIGSVALASQSGGVATYSMVRAHQMGVNIGCFASTGNEIDVDVLEVANHFLVQEEIRTVAIFSEGISEGAAFVALAKRAAALDKPMILLSAGRNEVSARAAMSHTGSVVGASNRVLQVLCEKYGVTYVTSLEQLLDVALMFQHRRRTSGSRVGVLVTSGGAGILSADAMGDVGLEIPELPAPDQEILLKSMPRPFYGATTNPVDTTAQIGSSYERYKSILDALGGSNVIDMLAPVLVTRSVGREKALIDFSASCDKPIAVTSGTRLEILEAAGIPTYSDASRTAFALSTLYKHSSRSTRVEPPIEIDAVRLEVARQLLRTKSFGGTLLESDSKHLMTLYGMQVTREQFVETSAEALTAAREIGFPVCLKVMSFQLPHKSEYGAIRLGVSSERETITAFDDMLREVGQRAPDAVIEGVLVQEMVPARFELACGLHVDPIAGPVVGVGFGGTMIEILGEMSLLIPPFGLGEIDHALRELAGGRLIGGTRGLSEQEQAGITRVLLGLGRLSIELPEIVELDLNPLRVSNGDVVTADALVVLDTWDE